MQHLSKINRKVFLFFFSLKAPHTAPQKLLLKLTKFLLHFSKQYFCDLAVAGGAGKNVHVIYGDYQDASFRKQHGFIEDAALVVSALNCNEFLQNV